MWVKDSLILLYLEFHNILFRCTLVAFCQREFWKEYVRMEQRLSLQPFECVAALIFFIVTSRPTIFS